MDNLQEQIEIAISSAFSECTKGAASPKTTRNKSNSKGAANVDVGEIVAKVLAALQPALVSMVAAAVKTSTEALLEEIKKAACPASTATTVQANKFEIDRLEQYSRRDNVKVIGIPETEGEDCVKKIQELASEIGVDMKDTDISVAHRVKSKGKKGNPIIVRFVRRESKIQMMMNKKKLKEQNKEIYIQEDLTQLRSRLLWTVKKDEGTEAAWLRDGKIHCLLKNPCKQSNGIAIKKVVIDTPDDLFNIGWDEDKMRGLYGNSA